MQDVTQMAKVLQIRTKLLIWGHNAVFLPLFLCSPFEIALAEKKAQRNSFESNGQRGRLWGNQDFCHSEILGLESLKCALHSDTKSIVNIDITVKRPHHGVQKH